MKTRRIVSARTEEEIYFFPTEVFDAQANDFEIRTGFADVDGDDVLIRIRLVGFGHGGDGGLGDSGQIRRRSRWNGH